MLVERAAGGHERREYVGTRGRTVVSISDMGTARTERAGVKWWDATHACWERVCQRERHGGERHLYVKKIWVESREM